MLEKSLKEQFIEKAKQVHLNVYDYSLIEYKNSRTKINIICPKHGIFEQRPNDHLQGRGCNLYHLDRKRDTKEEFVEKANKIFKNMYAYSSVVYENSLSKVEIICQIHGTFYQIPSSHLRGRGCPKCGVGYSKGELKIEKWLSDHNINYKTQYRFVNCKNKKPLPFDFFLPDHNVCIEFDGLYHYEPKRGLSELIRVMKCDTIKTKFCLDNGIKLVRIPYWESNKIDEILSLI
jgi:very-short-patch-repair endonuclease